MNDIHMLKEQFLSKIALFDIDVINEFSSVPITYLKEKPKVCIYLKSMSLTGVMLGDFAQASYEQSGVCSTAAKRAMIKLGLNIYCKESSCDGIFAQLAPALLFDSEADVRSINCISMEYKSDLKAYLLQADLEMERLVVANTDSTYFNSFLLNINNKEMAK